MPSAGCAANTLQQHLVGLQVLLDFCSARRIDLAERVRTGELLSFAELDGLVSSTERHRQRGARRSIPHRLSRQTSANRLRAIGAYLAWLYVPDLPQPEDKHHRAQTIRAHGQGLDPGLGWLSLPEAQVRGGFQRSRGPRQAGRRWPSQQKGRARRVGCVMAMHSLVSGSFGRIEPSNVYLWGRLIADMKLFLPVISQGPLYISTVGRRVV
jgi:hypothetical protein